MDRWINAINSSASGPAFFSISACFAFSNARSMAFSSMSSGFTAMSVKIVTRLPVISAKPPPTASSSPLEWAFRSSSPGMICVSSGTWPGNTPI